MGASMAGFTQAEVAAMTTTDLLALSIRGLGGVMLANPIALFATAIVGIVAAIDIYSQSQEEAIQKAKRIC